MRQRFRTDFQADTLARVCLLRHQIDVNVRRVVIDPAPIVVIVPSIIGGAPGGPVPMKIGLVGPLCQLIRPRERVQEIERPACR